MTASPQYILERMEHGWLLCSAPGCHGVPADALIECMSFFPSDAQVVSGIAHYYEQRHAKRVVMAIASPKESVRWSAEINKSLAQLPPEDRWFFGTDVGTSSATIFSVLAENRALAERAGHYSRGSTPQDSADLGRCLRLLAAFPGWRERLPEVAAAHPETAWPKLVAIWAKLEAADAKEQDRLLHDLS